MVLNSTLTLDSLSDTLLLCCMFYYIIIVMAFISFFYTLFSLFIHKHLIKMISKVCIPNWMEITPHTLEKKCFKIRSYLDTAHSKHRHNLRNKHYFLCTLKDKCEFVRFLYVLFHLQQWCLILGVCVKIFEYRGMKAFDKVLPKSDQHFLFRLWSHKNLFVVRFDCGKKAHL